MALESYVFEILKVQKGFYLFVFNVFRPTFLFILRRHNHSEDIQILTNAWHSWPLSREKERESCLAGHAITDTGLPSSAKTCDTHPCCGAFGIELVTTC